MELCEAIKTLVDSRGTDVVKSSLFINILNDFGAFHENVALKNVLRILIGDGYYNKIEFYSKSESDKNLACLTGIINEIERLYGIKNSIAKTAILSLAYGIGMIDSMPETTGYDASIDTLNETVDDIDEEVLGDNNDHLSFRNIPICGDSNSFAKKLISQGFVVTEHDPSGSYMLNGIFAGISNCDILINNSEFTNSVVRISVLLPTQNAWFSLKSDYEDLKSKFIKKYGQPENSYEFFTDPYYEGDGYELSAFSSGNAYYMSSFNIDNGSVLLAIMQGDRVIITYTDKTGSEKEESAKEICAESDL